MTEIWLTIKNFFLGNAFNIILFFCVLIFGIILIKLLLMGIRKLFKKSKLEPTVANFVVILIKFAMIMIYVLILCSILGIPITSLVALLTALSLAIGLAVQNSVSNLANGLVLLSTKPYKIGDYIEIGSASGTVVSVKMINTVLLTPTNEQITIPHNITATSVIKNYSVEEFRRIDIKVSVEYGSNVEDVKEALWKVVNNHENIIQDKDNRVRLLECGASSMDFTVRAWVKAPEYWNTYFDMQEQIVNSLKAHKISIPYNTIDVNIKSDNGVDSKNSKIAK